MNIEVDPDDRGENCRLRKYVVHVVASDKADNPSADRRMSEGHVATKWPPISMSLLGSGLVLVASVLRRFLTTTTFDDDFRVPRFKIQ